MQVFIRTDASIQIGSGHVMRCLTLAKQLQKKNVHVKFICRNFEGNLIKYITQQGFKVYKLSEINTTSHLNWTREHYLEDANETISIIKNEVVSMLIVDHYSINIQWEMNLRPYVQYMMVIDDIADRTHDCDLLLDQNYYLNMYNRYKNLVPNNCIQLLGPDYTLLREEFLDINTQNLIRNTEIRNILIFFGAVDSTGETLKTLNAFEKLQFTNIEINVVIGEQNPLKKEIEEICNRNDNYNLYCQINYIAKLMAAADLAFGAGGSASWERMYLRLPSVVTIIAENQKELTELLAKKNMIFLLGSHEEVNESLIICKVEELFNNIEVVQTTISRFTKIINYQMIRKYLVLNKIIELIQ